MKKITWLDDVADEDHEAAFQYLSPRLDARRAGQIVKSLKAAEVIARRDASTVPSNQRVAFSNPAART